MLCWRAPQMGDSSAGWRCQVTQLVHHLASLTNKCLVLLLAPSKVLQIPLLPLRTSQAGREYLLMHKEVPLGGMGCHFC